MHLGDNGNKSIPHGGRSSSSWDGYGSWMEVGVAEDGSGFLSDYDLDPTAAYEENGNGENVTSTFLMPWLQRSAWIGIFALMLVVAIAGNALVAWIVLGPKSKTSITLIAMKLYMNGFFLLLKTAHRRMKTVTNYFLVSRSLSSCTSPICIASDLTQWRSGSLKCMEDFIFR